MKKRLYLLIVSFVAIALVSVGLVAFAEQAPKSGSSDSVKGILFSVNASSHEITVTGSNGKHKYKLADSVWVYRNNKKAELAELKKADRLELILNSKDQVAYIKAVSGANHANQAKKDKLTAGTTQTPEATTSDEKQSVPQTETTVPAPVQQNDKVTDDQQQSTEVEGDDDDDAEYKVKVKVNGVEVGALHGKKKGWYKEHKHQHPHANVNGDDYEKKDHHGFKKNDDDEDDHKNDRDDHDHDHENERDDD